MHFLTWMNMAMVGSILVQLCSTMEPLLEAYKIVKLPGQPQVSFQQFSGYITVDEKQQRALFYYFVEAETDPASKPLVLWLNGGPGCSAIGAGAFIEHGPFRPSGENLVRNEYSWNKEANMLYLESPAGVGFSYSTNTSFYNGVDDKITARDNLMFLQRFLDKFPQYKSRNLFIGGVSYGGHYVPQLAQLLVQFNKKENLFNLKGIVLGNPLLDFNTDLNSRAEFMWSHGLISDSTYGIFTKTCNYSRYRMELNRGSVSPVCLEVMTQVNREISNFTNTQDVSIGVCLSSVFSQSKQVREKIDVCTAEKLVTYLNRYDVQKALHAHLVGVTRWNLCSNVLEYNKLDSEIPIIPIVGSLLKSGIAVFVYSGDQDTVLPFTASRTLVHELANKLGLNTTVPYRVWFEGQQVGGWTQVYGNRLSFATIRGGGHEPPFTQPGRSLVVFKAFLGGRPLPEAF